MQDTSAAPIQLADALGIAIPALFLVMLVVERLIPARPLPKVRFWLVKGLVFFLIAGAANAVLPLLFATLLGDHTLFHLQALPLPIAALLGAVAADLVSYGWHRFMHTFHPIWRFTHQMHHSAERMDLAGMSYQHPLDTLTSFSVTTVATLVLGLSPDAAALAGFIGFVLAVLQHSNIKTPRLLGYLVMRPEQHALHHGRGVHAYNYGNFALWDALFGTWRNPAAFVDHYGFWDGASAKMGAMLVGKDVGAAS